MPCTPTPNSASRTSSSLNGLMMAVMSFMADALRQGSEASTISALSPGFKSFVAGRAAHAADPGHHQSDDRADRQGRVFAMGNGAEHLGARGAYRPRGHGNDQRNGERHGGNQLDRHVAALDGFTVDSGRRKTDLPVEIGHRGHPQPIQGTDGKNR